MRRLLAREREALAEGVIPEEVEGKAGKRGPRTKALCTMSLTERGTGGVALPTSGCRGGRIAAVEVLLLPEGADSPGNIATDGMSGNICVRLR